MYNKVFKNYQVNMGNPYQVKAPMTSNIIKQKLMESLNEDKFEDEAEAEIENEEATAEVIIENAKKEAEFIIKEAEFEAERIIEEALGKAEEARLDVEKYAFEQGFEKGQTEAQTQYDDLIKEAEFIREHAKSEYEEVLRSMESDVVEVIIDIAKKVLNTELTQNKEAIFHIVKDAFSNCSNPENAVLKVSNEDFDNLICEKDKLLSMVTGLDDIQIKKDLSLNKGACIIETPFGTVDGGNDTKINKIEEAFKIILGKQAG